MLPTPRQGGSPLKAAVGARTSGCDIAVTTRRQCDEEGALGGSVPRDFGDLQRSNNTYNCNPPTLRPARGLRPPTHHSDAPHHRGALSALPPPLTPSSSASLPLALAWRRKCPKMLRAASLRLFLALTLAASLGCATGASKESSATAAQLRRSVRDAPCPPTNLARFDVTYRTKQRIPWVTVLLADAETCASTCVGFEGCVAFAFKNRTGACQLNNVLVAPSELRVGGNFDYYVLSLVTCGGTLAPSLAPTRHPSLSPTLTPTPAPTLAPFVLCPPTNLARFDVTYKTKQRIPWVTVLLADAEVCASTCVGFEGCVAFAFKNITGACQLNNVLVAPSELRVGGNFDYYVISLVTCVVQASVLSSTPTLLPSSAPTSSSPSSAPTEPPSAMPTASPSKLPSAVPSSAPSPQPTRSPSEPTLGPTPHPTTLAPTTAIPTKIPSAVPSQPPSANPSTLTPTGLPSAGPTPFPTLAPTFPICPEHTVSRFHVRYSAKPRGAWITVTLAPENSELCANLCISQAGCVAFAYKSATGTCNLQNSLTPPGELRIGGNFDYYVLWMVNCAGTAAPIATSISPTHAPTLGPTGLTDPTVTPTSSPTITCVDQVDSCATVDVALCPLVRDLCPVRCGLCDGLSTESPDLNIASSTWSPSQPPVAVNCTREVDVAFMLDASRTVTPLDWETLLHFVKSTIARLNVNSGRTRVAVVSFATEARIEFMFNTSASVDDMSARLNPQISPLMGGSSFLGSAMRHFREVMLGNSSGYRGRDFLLVVITDGDIQDKEVLASEHVALS